MQKLFTLFYFVVYSVACAQAQAPTEEWSNCYDISSSITTTDMAVDRFGNVAVAGYYYVNGSFYENHMFVVKYNSDGDSLWSAHFPGPNDSLDIATSVTFDKLGNLYVAGTRYDTVCNVCSVTTKASYFFLIKYDSIGNQMWMQKYNGPDSSLQSDAKIELGRGGYVYAIGNQISYGYPFNFYGKKGFAIKYSSGGAQQWIKFFHDKYFRDLAVGRRNNVIVVGNEPDTSNNLFTAFYALKLNSSGDSSWSHHYEEPGKNADAYFVKIDHSNGIVAMGMIDTVAYYNAPHLMTIKYSENNLQWVRKEVVNTRITPLQHGGIAFDSQNSIFITGYFHVVNTSTYRFHLSKYDPFGNLQWTQQYQDNFSGTDRAIDVATDNSGNAYVCGNAVKNNTTVYRYAVIQYSTDGNQKYIIYFTANSGNHSFPAAMVVDGAQNIYVSGLSAGSCTVKFSVVNSITELQTGDDAILFYPNPADDRVIVQPVLNLQDKILCRIFSLEGKLISSQEISLGNSAIDVSSMSDGTYLLQIIQSGESQVSKLIVIH